MYLGWSEGGIIWQFNDFLNELLRRFQNDPLPSPLPDFFNFIFCLIF